MSLTDERRRKMRLLLDEAAEDVMITPAKHKTVEVRVVEEIQYAQARRFINAIYGVKRLMSEVEKISQEITVMVLEGDDFVINNPSFDPWIDEALGVEVRGDAKRVLDWCVQKNLNPQVIYSYTTSVREAVFPGIRQFKIVIVW